MRTRAAEWNKRWLPVAVLVAGWLCFPGAVAAQSDLRDYVALIEANPYPETRELFASLAETFEGESPELASFFAAYAEGGGFGSGWVFVDSNGENFVVTNQHVVTQAGSVTIKFEQPDGTFEGYSDSPIVYVDPVMDLAVVQFPGAQRVFDRGFPLDTASKPDGTELFAAGFPGFGNEPLWQFSAGIVTNARARPRTFSDYDYVIQHSAQIDPGNSGGPLMVRDPSSPTGFSVVGVNTWKANQRSNTNFSIPATEVPGLIQRARESNSILADQGRLAEELERSARILASELASPNADTEQIDRFISYALVGRRGWEAFQSILDIVSASRDDLEFWQQSFFSDPIETMRMALYFQLWIATGTEEQRPDTRFEEILVSDEDRIGDAGEIRTRFMLGGRSTELSWGWEYGGWKIRDFEISLPSQTSEAPGRQRREPEGVATSGDETPAALYLLGGRAALGVTASAGQVYSVYSTNFPEVSSLFDQPLFQWDIGLSVERFVLPSVWVETGLALSRRGRFYQFNSSAGDVFSEVDDLWVQEEIVYLSVPIIARYRLTPVPGFTLVAGAGLSANAVVRRGGRYWDYSDDEFELPASWFESDFPRTFALSFIVRAGIEIGLGDRVVGAELTYDRHLTRDFAYTGVTESASFRSLNLGATVRFPFALAATTRREPPAP